MLLGLTIFALVIILLLQFLAYTTISGDLILVKEEMIDIRHQNDMLRQQIDIITENIPTLKQAYVKLF